MSLGLRNRKKVNYALLNKGKHHESSSEEYENEDIDIKTEQELVEDDLDYLDVETDEEEDEFLEDGEIDSESNSDTDNNEVNTKQLVLSKDANRIREIIKAKKAKCRDLQKEICMEKQKEKDKEIKQLLAELEKVSKTEQSLEQTLATSRNNTPTNSPNKTKKKHTTVKSTIRKVRRRTDNTASPPLRGRISKKKPNKKDSDDKSEYESVLETLLNLKQGRAEAYTDLVDQAMSATDNIIKLKKNQDDGKIEIRSKVNKVGQMLNKDAKCNSSNSEHDDKVQALQLLNAIQTKVKGGQVIDSATLSSIMGGANCEDTHNESNNAVSFTSESDTEPFITCENVKKTKKKPKKLVSGKCTKPDEVDIQQVVSFAHQKLDARHVTASEKVFDKLTSNLLVAGELELAAQPHIDQKERIARINIAKTICYHQSYLSDSEIRGGYDQLLKKVEQGVSEWDSNLGESLHEYYDYQANKIIRDKLNKEHYKTDRSSNSQHIPDTRITRSDTKKTEEQTIFCGLYNKGKCNFEDHHEGRFSNRPVTKWHICSRCLKNGEKRSHPEGDPACPNKA